MDEQYAGEDQKEWDKHSSFRHKIAPVYPPESVLGVFQVIWTNGWDGDENVAVVKTGRKAFLVTTDHGGLRRVKDSFLDGGRDHRVPHGATARALLGR